MPRIRPLLCAATLIVLGAGPLLAQPPATPPAPHMGHHAMKHPTPAARLTVTGQGQATAQPDIASITLGVSTRAETAAAAMEQNAAAQAKVIEALKAEGVEARDIQTSGLNLSPMLDFSDGQAPRVTGYVAQNVVSVQVRDLARLGPVLDQMVASGANEISGISFSREDMTEARDEARAGAVADARRRAEVMARAAGMELGRLIALSEGQAMDGPRPMVMMAAEAKRADTPIEAGELGVSASVTAVFAMRPAGEPEAPAPEAEGEAAEGEAPAN